MFVSVDIDISIDIGISHLTQKIKVSTANKGLIYSDCGPQKVLVKLVYT
jgi:hypothetical protein